MRYLIEFTIGACCLVLAIALITRTPPATEPAAVPSVAPGEPEVVTPEPGVWWP
jgi:hypothetical protein